MIGTLPDAPSSSLLSVEQDHFFPPPLHCCRGLVLPVVLHSATFEPDRKPFVPWMKVARNLPWMPGENSRKIRSLLYKYRDLLSAEPLNKNRPLLTRSNLIGHAIFLTGVECRSLIRVQNSYRFSRHCSFVPSVVLFTAPSHGAWLDFKSMIS